MATELLTKNSVIPYLQSRGLISGAATVEELTGGVSCVVLAVKSETKDLVVKQALPELKVATLWQADQRRAIVEAHAMKLLHSITPASVPDLIDLDEAEFTLTMSRLPHESTNWKLDMLDGEIHPSIGSDLGKILATWHNFGFKNEGARAQFSEDSLFDQLRVSPFYRAVAAKNALLAQNIQELIDELNRDKSTIVHGDFSPKNIMITAEHKPIVLDFEVMHTGNPVFDLAFLCAHLLCKFMRTENPAAQILLRESAKNFLDSYGSNCDIPIAQSLPRHIALIALARVEGVSLVNYLDAAGQLRITSKTKSIIANPMATFEELFQWN